MKENNLKYKNHYYELYSYLNGIKFSDTCDIDMLKNIYIRFKEIIPYYYNNGKMNRKYDNLIEILIKIENLYNNKYIMNKNIYIDENLNISKDSSKEEILDYIVNQTRSHINNLCFLGRNDIKDINSLSFENMCGYSSFYVMELCNKLNIKARLVNIEPGYLKDSFLFDGSNHHYITIAELDNEYYIIDCTYKQFFKLGKTLLDRLGIVNCSPPRVGAYMVMNDRRKNLANIILEKGYFKYSDDSFKDYMDGFTISFRNGLYYENTRDFSFKTEYTAEDYISFLEYRDNMLYYESLKYLGFQRIPLNNNKLTFKLSQ